MHVDRVLNGSSGPGITQAPLCGNDGCIITGPDEGQAVPRGPTGPTRKSAWVWGSPLTSRPTHGGIGAAH